MLRVLENSRKESQEPMPLLSWVGSGVVRVGLTRDFQSGSAVCEPGPAMSRPADAPEALVKEFRIFPPYSLLWSIASTFITDTISVLMSEKIDVIIINYDQRDR